MVLPVIPIINKTATTAQPAQTMPGSATKMVSAQTAATFGRVTFWTGAVVGALAGAGLVWWLKRR